MRKLKGFLMSLVFTMVLSFSMGATSSANSDDIVDTAVKAGSFNTLAAALEKADLIDALKGEGPFTVFAPTDEAFAKLLSELGVTAEELLAREDLKDILLYHVVSGKVMSTDLTDGMEAATLKGDKVRVSLNPAQINDSNVTTADIEASNGVIHVIDAVLLPVAQESAPPIPKTGNDSIFSYALLAVFAGTATLYFYRRGKAARG
ncbi:fasciclin domain-containing protein [Ammoniphilus sp. CFH 90114]|uniref:fasciclin domain-containing protein n=1 Tax=Ammoniphilus sp. CFH 90114 TaxID=2493665 RepID=UPI00100FDBBB|nr:fasciclin domain-containing protein [Ammoniphilus sp. CFH 90114]RXT02812.1 fasciclin domain-containing protein [Ammoniphilus sp. CFH 90114]